MPNGLYAAAAGAQNQERVLDTVANNLANASSAGFKGQRVTFREVLVGQVAGGQARETVRYSVPAEVQTDFRTGNLQDTGRPLDAAIRGSGFFAVQTAEGEAYTRAGSFVPSPDGVLTTLDGKPVLGNDGPISLQAVESVQIMEDGTVNTPNGPLGQLRVVDFAAPQNLERVGEGLWRAQNNQQPRDLQPNLEVGVVEQSNVNIMENMTRMIAASRSFESMHRVIQVYRDVDAKTANELK